MNIEVVSENSFARKVLVTVPAADVRAELDRAYRTYERRARLPGFRQGRVPRQVLEARFGQGIAAEVAESLVQRGWSAAMRDHGIEPVSQPSLLDQGTVAAAVDFTFTIGVDVKPAVALSTYKGLKVEWPEFALPEGLVEAGVERRRRTQARLAAVEGRPVELGDTVQVKVTVVDGDTVVLDEPGTLVRTGSEQWLKGIEDFLVGMAVGEEKSGAVTFNEAARQEEVAGRTLAVTASVLSIQAMTVPPLDDALAKELGHDSVDALRAAVQSELEAGRDEQARNQARANLLQALIDANPVDVPSGMVEQNVRLLQDELRYQAAYRGEDPNTLRFGDAQLADLRQRALFAARGALLLEAVWSAESIEVTEADIDARIAEIAAQRGQSVEAVRGWLAKDDGIEELSQRMLEEKTLDFLLDQSEVVKVAPDAAAPEAAEAPEASAAEPAAEGADLSVLDGAIKDVKDALSTGAYDAHLDALLVAEQSGRNRKGAIQAIEARREG